MTRYIIAAISGGIVATAMGAPWYLGVIGGLVLMIMLSPSTPTHRVMIENVQTGEVKIQPNDRATQSYIAGRGE